MNKLGVQTQWDVQPEGWKEISSEEMKEFEKLVRESEPFESIIPESG